MTPQDRSSGRVQALVARQRQEMMKALVWRGAGDVRVEERPRPVIGSPGDAIVRVTSSFMCGSDLHMYHHAMPGMREGDVLGHVFMGRVEEVGADVTGFQPGDRVVASCFIIDGTCRYCQEGLVSLCEGTNPNPVMKTGYGDPLAAAYGYSHLAGGFDGGHAQFVRVPFAEHGLLKVPDTLTDDQAVLLADNLPTGWMAADYADAMNGGTIAVWGCGPTGLLAQYSARVMGAERIIAIDNVPERLEAARRHAGAETIDYREHDVVERILELTDGRGADACIECAGFRYTKSLHHRVERALKLETDGIDAVTECIRAARKNGTVVLIGDFIGYTNHFPVGAMMEKGLTVRGGQVNTQAYWPELLPRLESGEMDPSWVITHHFPLEEGPEAMRLFDRKEGGVIGVVLNPDPEEVIR